MNWIALLIAIAIVGGGILLILFAGDWLEEVIAFVIGLLAFAACVSAVYAILDHLLA